MIPVKLPSSGMRFDCWMKYHWLIDELKPFFRPATFLLARIALERPQDSG
jgi:hypothetical protein